MTNERPVGGESFLGWITNEKLYGGGGIQNHKRFGGVGLDETSKKSKRVSQYIT